MWSSKVTASTLVTGAGVLRGLVVTASADTVKATIHHGSGVSGEDVMSGTAVANTSWGIHHDKMPMPDGVYCDVSGSGVTAYVLFE